MVSKRELYFSTGNQYYVSGRFAAFAGFIPVASNLLHHAVEMYLKGELSKKLSDEQLRQELGHKLPRIWERFKGSVGDPALDRFDEVIVELDHWELIRYPDEIMKKGMSGGIKIAKKERRSGPTYYNNPIPTYTVSIYEIDELVQVIHAASSVNPRLIEDLMMDEREKDYLYRENHAFPKP